QTVSAPVVEIEAPNRPLSGWEAGTRGGGVCGSIRVLEWAVCCGRVGQREIRRRKNTVLYKTFTLFLQNLYDLPHPRSVYSPAFLLSGQAQGEGWRSSFRGQPSPAPTQR